MREKDAFLLMMGDSRLCSSAEGNVFVEGKRGHNHGSKSPKSCDKKGRDPAE